MNCSYKCKGMLKKLRILGVCSRPLSMVVTVTSPIKIRGLINGVGGPCVRFPGVVTPSIHFASRGSLSLKGKGVFY